MEGEELVKAIVATVGNVEMLKSFLKGVRVPAALWVIFAIVLGVVYSLPFIPVWVLNAAVVVSASTLFYDTIVQGLKKFIAKKLGGDNE